MPPRLILASSSPRRRELLSSLGLEFVVQTSHVDETFDAGLPPADVARSLAEKKARAVANATHDPAEPTLILAADTIVVHGGTILGKPQDEDEAVAMLTRLQGQTHTVYTGVCLIRLPGGQMENFIAQTDVTMGTIEADDILRYVHSGDPMDKAGSYGIQGKGAVLVERIVGDYFTVVGLPVRQVALLLKKHGMPVL